MGSLTEEGERQLYVELGVRTIIDLRSVPQIDRAGGIKQIEGITRYWAPVFEMGMYSPEKAGQRYLMYCGEGEVSSNSLLLLFGVFLVGGRGWYCVECVLGCGCCWGTRREGKGGASNANRH